VELQGAPRSQLCWAVTFWTSSHVGANSHRRKLEQANRYVTCLTVSLFFRCVLCIAYTCKYYFCQWILFADTPTCSLYLQRIWISMYPARATMALMSSPDFLVSKGRIRILPVLMVSAHVIACFLSPRNDHKTVIIVCASSKCIDGVANILIDIKPSVSQVLASVT
jgi:hypothetical protein